MSSPSLKGYEMATQFSVKYDDIDDVVVYTVKPKHILKVERESGGLQASIEASYMLAWMASGSDVTFDEWLDTVEDITPLGVDEDVEANPI